MTLNKRLLGGNPVHILVLYCYLCLFNFSKKIKKKSCMPPNHFAGYDLGTWSIIQGDRSNKWSKTIDKDFNKKLDDFLRREDWAKIWFYLSNSLFFSVIWILFSVYLFILFFGYFVFCLFTYFFLVCFNCLFCILNKFVVFVSFRFWIIFLE